MVFNTDGGKGGGSTRGSINSGRVVFTLLHIGVWFGSFLGLWDIDEGVVLGGNFSHLPGHLFSLGMMHLTKWGQVRYKLCISLCNCSCR